MSIKAIGLNQGIHAGHFSEFVRNTLVENALVMPNKKCGICGHTIGLEAATRMTNLSSDIALPVYSKSGKEKASIMPEKSLISHHSCAKSSQNYCKTESYGDNNPYALNLFIERNYK